MRKTAVRLGKYGVLKLTGDLIVSDMDLTEDTSALCLQGHKLTIRNRDNHQSTWKGRVDLGGVGGMPQAVAAFAREQKLDEVEFAKKLILDLYYEHQSRGVCPVRFRKRRVM